MCEGFFGRDEELPPALCVTRAGFVCESVLRARDPLTAAFARPQVLALPGFGAGWAISVSSNVDRLDADRVVPNLDESPKPAREDARKSACESARLEKSARVG